MEAQQKCEDFGGYLAEPGTHRYTLLHSLSITDSEHTAIPSKQIFPEKELGGLSPNFHIHVSVSGDLYIPMIGLPILLKENTWIDPVPLTEFSAN